MKSYDSIELILLHHKNKIFIFVFLIIDKLLFVTFMF